MWVHTQAPTKCVSWEKLRYILFQREFCHPGGREGVSLVLPSALSPMNLKMCTLQSLSMLSVLGNTGISPSRVNAKNSGHPLCSQLIDLFVWDNSVLITVFTFSLINSV